MKVVALWLLLAVSALAQEGIVIEQFEVDFKNDGQLGLQSVGWDLYVKIPYTNTCPVCHEQIGNCVRWEHSTYITNETGYIIGRDVPTEVHCPIPECGAPLGIDFPKEFDPQLYAYHYWYTDQVNVHFIISVPKEWCSERLLAATRRPLDWYDGIDELAESGIGLWATDELGHDSVLLFGYGENDGRDNSLGKQRRYTCPGQGDAGSWRFETQNITPDDYPPTRVLIDIKASYLVQVNRGSGSSRPEPCSLLGNELKQTFYYFTYTPLD